MKRASRGGRAVGTAGQVGAERPRNSVGRSAPGDRSGAGPAGLGSQGPSSAERKAGRGAKPRGVPRQSMLVAFLFPVALAAQAPRAAGLGLRGPGPAAPQAGRPAPTAATILRQLAATHQFTEVALSPDGARAAWVEELYAAGPALGNDTGTSRIHVQGLAAPITAASSTRAAAEGGIVWSPDGSRLAFGGPARQLTHLTGFLTDARWSPDGSSLAFLFAENAPSGGGPLHPEPPA